VSEPVHFSRLCGTKQAEGESQHTGQYSAHRFAPLVSTTTASKSSRSPLDAHSGHTCKTRASLSLSMLLKWSHTAACSGAEARVKAEGGAGKPKGMGLN
jgi:hypothetical protein